MPIGIKSRPPYTKDSQNARRTAMSAQVIRLSFVRRRGCRLFPRADVEAKSNKIARV